MIGLKLYLLSFVLGAYPSPIQDAGHPVSHGIAMKLSRRSFRQQPPVQGPGALPICDPTYAQRELQGLVEKYARAAQYLDGVDLAPPQNLTNYPAVVDISSAFLSSASISADSSGDANPLFTPGPTPVLVATGTAVMPLQDQISGSVDVQYYGPMRFGTPPQSLTVDIDTGSADLWVPVNCPRCNNHQLNTRASSTYQGSATRFGISYGSGQVSGTLASDVVSVSGLTVQKQAFGAVNQESDNFNDSPNDGLIGMAFGTIAQSRKPTFFENLMDEKAVAAPLFSIHLTRNRATGSEVCFGCYDTTKTTGTITWVPVKSKTYWAVSMDALAIGSTSKVTTDLVAAIDTGTTFIYVPDSVASQFYGMIPGAQAAPQYGSGFYTFPCDSQLDIAFSFSGKSFSLNLIDFNLGRTASGSSDCVGGILSLGGDFPDNLAIIGDEFLKSWYSTYDYSGGARVGFSPSINNPS